jgi:ADP-heptose:LPS heptosyltransferase
MLSLERGIEQWREALEKVAREPQFRKKILAELESKAEEVFTTDELPNALALILKKIDGNPSLLGVGSGLGNLVHTTPVVSSLGRNTPIDVVVNVEHTSTLFIFQNLEYVRYVFNQNSNYGGLHYKHKLMMHSWGRLKPKFDDCKWTRDHSMFRPRNLVHEAEFNWNSVAASLPDLAENLNPNKYFVGELEKRQAKRSAGKPILGIHAGSKDGHWSSKRWPHFESMTAQLASQYELRAFGVEGEQVIGAEDCTGGTVEKMAKLLTECDYFIGNDSGVTHLAYALGIPTIFIFGPTAVPSRGPSPNFGVTQTLVPGASCYPCEITDPSKFESGGCRCITDISVTQVLKALDRLKESESES